MQNLQRNITKAPTDPSTVSCQSSALKLAGSVKLKTKNLKPPKSKYGKICTDTKIAVRR
jgi:hypothetical protein